MIELLAPAGSMEALRAAVQNGANAVYLGCGSFNARQSAKNFTIQTLSEAVKYCHVRGGTILHARGVAREDAAAFFGITLHAEKEILMMVVEKELRDTVLNAIYKEMGMAKKAQGIAFSLPVNEAVGLAAAPIEEKPTE